MSSTARLLLHTLVSRGEDRSRMLAGREHFIACPRPRCGWKVEPGVVAHACCGAANPECRLAMPGETTHAAGRRLHRRVARFHIDDPFEARQKPWRIMRASPPAVRLRAVPAGRGARRR